MDTMSKFDSRSAAFLNWFFSLSARTGSSLFETERHPPQHH